MLIQHHVATDAGHRPPRDQVDSDLADPDDLASALRSVIAGEQLAVRFPDYYPSWLAERMSKRIIEHEDFGHYAKAPDIGKVGFPYYDTVGNADLEPMYWAQAPSWNGKVRSAHWPEMSPIDRVRLELDESWPHGASLLRDAGGRAAFAGLARVFEDGAEALPHVDRLEWDAPIGRFGFEPIAQIAANVYLRMPPAGGELAIWDIKPEQGKHEDLRIPGSYGLKRELLSEPKLVLKPRQGELVFFDARNVHAVYASAGGPRVTVSFFIVLSAEGEAYIYS